MAAISLKCLLEGSQSSHQPPRIGRGRNIPPGRAMLLIGRISGCLNKKNLRKIGKKHFFENYFKNSLHFVNVLIFLNIAFNFANLFL
jgi:hypothetical protein